VKKVAIAIWLVNSNLEENGSTSVFPRKPPFFTFRLAGQGNGSNAAAN
jgi:hypothetical protein